MFKRWCLIFLCTSQVLHGVTTYSVTSATDSDPGGRGQPGELRYFLNIMNEDLASSAEDRVIKFETPMTITLNGTLPIINNSANPVSIMIGNSGSTPTVTIDGNGLYSGFFIPIGTVTIQNMIFQNCVAKGGDGGSGISGGGGGLGAGGAIYVPEVFLNGFAPQVNLRNVLINSCSAIGGNGGSYLDSYPNGSATGDEGGGGGGGFGGNGGSITIGGNTGGGGGGGFGGNGGDATVSSIDPLGGGGGGGGGIGSRATFSLFPIENLGNGGSDQEMGQDGSAYADPLYPIIAGVGGGGYNGGSYAGGGGGGGAITAFGQSGGGGGGSSGTSGQQPQGSTPRFMTNPSGGGAGDGGGGGGGGVVSFSVFTNFIDGQAGPGGYGGGGGGGAGGGAYDTDYTVNGGAGGLGGGGGGGGVNDTGSTSANGGDSYGGGGGGGGGPAYGLNSAGGIDQHYLGGGSGGDGANSTGFGFGGGGGGGGSGLGGAIFVDSNLNFTIEAIPGIPTTFNTINTTVQAGMRGTSGSGGGTDGLDGSAYGNSIFLRSGSSLTFLAQNSDDLLVLGDGVAFVDDTQFGVGGTAVFVRGNGTIIYNGTTDYQGNITINNANFEVNGEIDNANVSVCRNISFSSQRGMLSGSGILTGSVLANSGTIAPSVGETLTLGSLFLNPADPMGGALGSLVYSAIDASGAAFVHVLGSATLAGTVEIDLDVSAASGSYTILSADGGISGTFDSITFTGPTPNYTLSYLPVGSPTFVRFDFLGYLDPASNFQGVQKTNNFGLEYELYNQLSWTASPSSTVVSYFIYRNGTKIATVNADTVTYQDHNRPAGVATVYALEAVDANGNVSTPVTATVP